MLSDRLIRVFAAYGAGAVTKVQVCGEIFTAAGEGDADAVFANIPPEFQAAIALDVAQPLARPDELFILESVCTTDPGAYADDLRRRTEVARRGFVALREVVRRRGYV
jgi:hypothetical protein